MPLEDINKGAAHGRRYLYHFRAAPSFISSEGVFYIDFYKIFFVRLKDAYNLCFPLKNVRWLYNKIWTKEPFSFRLRHLITNFNTRKFPNQSRKILQSKAWITSLIKDWENLQSKTGKKLPIKALLMNLLAWRTNHSPDTAQL